LDLVIVLVCFLLPLLGSDEFFISDFAPKSFCCLALAKEEKRIRSGRTLFFTAWASALLSVGSQFRFVGFWAPALFATLFCDL